MNQSYSQLIEEIERLLNEFSGNNECLEIIRSALRRVVLEKFPHVLAKGPVVYETRMHEIQTVRENLFKRYPMICSLSPIENLVFAARSTNPIGENPAER